MVLKYSPKAEKQLAHLPKSEQAKIARKIRILKVNPLAGKKLQAKFEGLRSLKVWPYRVFYYFSTKEQLIYIDIIEHRQQAYK